MTKVCYRWVWGVVLLVFSAALALVLWPDQPARALTLTNGWKVDGKPSSLVPAASFPPQYQHVRAEQRDATGVLFRSWTPDFGIQPLQVESNAFVAPPYLSVLITGNNRVAGGGVTAELVCQSNGERLTIFRGNVGVGLNTANVAVPAGWCRGESVVRLQSRSMTNNVGLGTVYEISRLAYLKSGFLGQLPAFMVTVGVLGFVLLAGAAIGKRMGSLGHGLNWGVLLLGVSSLLAVYLVSVVGERHRLTACGVLLLANVMAWIMAGRDARRLAFVGTWRPLALWIGASFLYFSLNASFTNGLGHWDPNFRFWPAYWSSDNELPWMFAEALLNGNDLRTLFGGVWLPTDRPPLMAGTHLLLALPFRLIWAADPQYFLPLAYNAAVVPMGALWIPVAYAFLRTPLLGLDRRKVVLILVFVGATPFAVFNAIYGWPKAYGAAFVLAPLGLLWLAGQRRSLSTAEVLVACCLLALGTLAHASMALSAALLFVLLAWLFRRTGLSTAAPGLALAAALYGSWGLYRALKLPGSDALSKYALTGDFGFGKADVSTLQLVQSTYLNLGWSGWLDAKAASLLQSFVPVVSPVANIRLDFVHGASGLDRMRSFEFLTFTGGNFAIIAALGLAIMLSCHAACRSRDQGHALRPLVWMMGSGILAWLAMVVVFLAPVILHHWPAASIYMLAIGSAGVLAVRWAAALRVLTAILLVYMAVVWMVLPAGLAQAADPWALFAFAAAVAAAVFLYGRRSGLTCHGRARSTRSRHA